MRTQLENIARKDRSFSTIFNPRLSDLFYWHFHPEYELVFIESLSGPRHVGDHISTYQNNDLVLIGSNIPHLNFDFGVKTDYRKVVIHFKKEFIEQHFLEIPELNQIIGLFEKSKQGIAFKGPIKNEVGERLFQLEQLDPFEQYVQLIDILYSLSQISDIELLHKEPYRNKFSERAQERLRDIYAFVDKNYHRKIALDEVANISNMTKEAFCRYFKKVSSYTFVEFLNRYRISQAKRLLMSGQTVSAACYETGFESLSYFNRIFKKVANENPRDFRKAYF